MARSSPVTRWAPGRARLADELRALEDPDTGRPLVDDVLDVRQLHGPRAADEFADLLVVWSQDGPIAAARSATVGVVRGSPPPARTGNHTPRWLGGRRGSGCRRNRVRRSHGVERVRVVGRSVRGADVSARVLVVVWESAERELIDRWTADGTLPTLARLRRAGAWHDVDSPAGFADDAAWTSFCTGAGVEEHERSHYQTVARNGHDLLFWKRNTTPLPPFWDTLARSGSRVAVIDIPSVTGCEPDALVVSDWTVHAPERPEPYVSGPGLTATIVRDPDWSCDQHGRDADATRALVRSLVDRASLRRDVQVDLLRQQDWDLFVGVMTEPHCVQHQCWHDHDPTHPEHDAARRAECGDPVEAVFRSLDRDLEQLIDAAAPDAVVVLSLLGMAPEHSGEHLVDEILVRLEGADDRPSFRFRTTRALRRMVPSWVRRHTPGRVRQAHRDTVTRERSRRSAWLLPSALPTSAIRIGVVGRDDGGTVEPGGALAARCARLADELRALEDPDTGRALVDDVIDVRQAHGPRSADGFADLLVVWSRAARITGACSSKVGVVRGAPPPARTGNHTTRGWAVTAGPDVDATTRGAPMAASDFAAFVGNMVVNIPH